MEEEEEAGGLSPDMRHWPMPEQGSYSVGDVAPSL